MIDRVSPVITAMFPLDGDSGVIPEAVVRLEFSESVQEDFILMVSNEQGETVEGNVTLTLGNTVAIFTPDNFLEPNSTYLIQLENVKDRAGNLLANEPVIKQFETVDTIIPVIDSLGILGDPIEGETIFLQPNLIGEDIVRVDVLLGGQFFQSLSIPPYEIQITIPTGQIELEIAAIAIDRSGNQSVPETLTILIQENQNPSIELNYLSGSPTVSVGETIDFEIISMDDVALTEIRISTLGILQTSALSE